MVNYPPEHCPYCGAALSTTTVDGHDHGYCPDCERPIFHNPVPNARVAVVDGDHLLLVRQGVGDNAGDWLLPGGHVELGVQPPAHAAKELREETGLRVDPDDLALALVRTLEPVPDHQTLGMVFSVDRSAVDGPLDPGSDARDARFWRPDELTAHADESFRELTWDPRGSDDPGWWLRLARSAVEDGPRRRRRE